MHRESNLANTPYWEDIWARFSLGLLALGLEAGKHGFYQAGVRNFFKFLKPRKWNQADRENAKSFLNPLAEEGKLGWRWIWPNRAWELIYTEVWCGLSNHPWGVRRHFRKNCGVAGYSSTT